MKTKIILFTMSALFFLAGEIGCEKKSEDLTNVVEKVAIISFANPSVDGCGWLINIDNEDYHAVNLTDDFKVDKLKVLLKYKLLPSIWECPQWESRQYKEIKILEMKKQ